MPGIRARALSPLIDIIRRFNLVPEQIVDPLVEEGLLNFVADTHEAMDEHLEALITKITANSPTAIRMGKKAIHAIQDMDLNDSFEYTQLMIEKISLTDDAKEGIAAFTEKRKPQWS